jgi:5-methylcytosine-specific restriction endonuclease McrA
MRASDRVRYAKKVGGLRIYKDLCGTLSGYRKHMKNKEKPCNPCQEAKRIDSKKFYHKNIEKERARSALYRSDNPEKRREVVNAYSARNREHLMNQSRLFRLLNPEKEGAKSKKYKQSHPDVARRGKHRRRARIANVGSEVYTEKLILEMYGTLCHICKIEIDLTAPRVGPKPGWEMGLHIDHVFPIARGGSDTIDNVRPSHAKCNLSKGART